MHPFPLRAAALAVLALFATTANQAQSLGGMLNQAKAKTQAKVSQATSAGASPRRAAAAATGATDYQLPPNLSNDPSIKEMEDYARAMLADPRPLSADEMRGSGNEPNRLYRKLTLNEGYPVKFTWDQGAMAIFKKNQVGLFPTIENFCEDIDGGIASYTSYHVQLGAALHKVKEIHFTSVVKPAMTGDYGQDRGFWFSFNPASGVLTAAMTNSETLPGPSSVSGSSSALTWWIRKHIQ